MGAIDVTVQQILKTFESCDYAWGTFSDISRAFDYVDHDILLCKLELWVYYFTYILSS